MFELDEKQDQDLIFQEQLDALLDDYVRRSIEKDEFIEDMQARLKPISTLLRVSHTKSK